MGKLVVYNNKSVLLTAKQNINLPLSVGAKLSAQYYGLDIIIAHTNSATVTVTDFVFLKAIMENINFEAGSGTKIIDLPPRDLILLQLIQRGLVNVALDKTTVGATSSKVRIFIDMTLIGFLSPKDSLFQTWRYGHRAINIEGGDFTIANTTIDSVQVKVIEQFNNGASPVYITNSKNQRVEFNVTKKPISKDTPITGTETEKEIEFPKNRKITGILIYAYEPTTGDIVDGCIDNIKIKNAETHIYGSVPFDTANVINRSEKIFQDSETKYFDNVAFIDLAQGKLSKAPDTSNIEEQFTSLYLDVQVNGHTTPQARVIFLTVSK
jgi:hypothetical protein